MAWQTKGSAKGQGKGGQSYLEKALQGAVFSALGLDGAASAGKGAEKGKGKGDAAEQCFVCKWQDCRAGRFGLVTWGKPCCFSCLRPKAQALAPPVESMSLKAYEDLKRAEKLKVEKPATVTNKAGKGSAGKGKTQNKGKGPPAAGKAADNSAATQDKADLLDLRAERLKELKSIKQAD